MPTFTQAQTVAPGDALKASQLASLAAAINSRVLSGVGDMVWRIAYYLHSGLFRQLRNSDGAYSFPPDGEFWSIYQHVNPSDAQYPLTGPGDPEGANLANQINAFVYGGESIGLDSELVRLSQVPTSFADGLEMTPTRFWALGQAQRGAFDPNTGAAAWPAGDVAQSYAWVRASTSSPHGNAWGGWLPYPVDAGGCTDPQDTNYQIKFTNLNTGAVRNYTTNCPEDSGRVGVAYSPFAYILFFGSGAVEVLLKSEWIEGPYTDDAQLFKTSANAIARVLNTYASEFRGTASQGAGTTNASGFDLQKFLTTQYPLAPNIGGDIGGGNIAALYPAWLSGITGASGSLLPFTAGGTSHLWASGHVCTGFLIKSGALTAPCSIDIEEDGEVIHSASFGIGESDALWWLPTARRLGSIKVRLTSTLAASAGGGIYLEATELVEMKPQIHDYYLVTRLSYYSGSLERIDGRGIDCDQAKEILTNLYSVGCVTPVTAVDGLGVAGLDPVLNQNAVFDAARRFSKHVRIIPRWNLTGYALESGKSVLWFNRTAYGPAGFPDRDMWEGIGPAQEEIGDFPIKWGREYIVTSGAVTYQETSYSVGQRFTGQQGNGNITGGGKVKEYDGIKQEAEPNDYSNRWALTMTLKPYANDTSSSWKPDAYADILTPFLNRCHIDSPEIGHSKQNKRQITFGIDPYVPESPTGFNYNRVRDSAFPGETHVNKLNCGGDPVCEAYKLGFYKSCRIYEPPVEIESAVMDGAELKVTLTGRLHYHASADAATSRDVTTWDQNNLRNVEDYRTHENGIREYLLFQGTGLNASKKTGDVAINSTLLSDVTPFGCCFPTFILAKLIPEPYLDGNDTQDQHDSYTTHDQLKQAELYLRAGCEGFVDGITTTSRACEVGGVSAYDYTYENLMFQACENRWVPLMPSSVRADNPYSFGPLPNVNYYGVQFNALANAVNLLTDARIMLPSEGEHRLISGSATGSINVSDACGDGVACAGLTSGTFVYGSANLAAPATTASAWNAGLVNGSGFGISMVQDTSSGVACTGSRWNIVSSRNDMQIRWVLTDPDSYYALPGNLGSLLETNSVAAMSIYTSVDTFALAYGTLAEAAGNSSGNCGGVYGRFEVTNDSSTVCGGMRNTISAPDVGGLVGIAYESALVIAGAGPASASSPTIWEDGTALVRIPTVDYAGGS